jgi:hypothetical protein
VFVGLLGFGADKNVCESFVLTFWWRHWEPEERPALKRDSERFWVDLVVVR